MIHRSYKVDIIEDGPFDREFRRFLAQNPHAGVWLLESLEEFAKYGGKHGGHVRQNRNIIIYAIPPYTQLQNAGGPGVLVRVCEDERKVEPILFIRDGKRHNWPEQIKRIERCLGI